MSSSSPPMTIVLVAGGFHRASTMDLFATILQEKGYNTQTSGLITVNGPGVSLEEDAKSLAESTLRPLVDEQGKDVVMYLHSYAGFPGSMVIGGFSKAERTAAGKQGGVIGLIYQSAFVPRQEVTLTQMQGGGYAPWQIVDETAGLVYVKDPITIFYADVPRPLAESATSDLLGQSIRSIESPPGSIYYDDAAYDGRRVYIHNTQDQALPPEIQDKLVRESGVEWKVVKMETSHSPFLSVPERLAEVVDEAVRGFKESF